jgi:hypothetical protein
MRSTDGKRLTLLILLMLLSLTLPRLLRKLGATPATAPTRSAAPTPTNDVQNGPQVVESRL